jgi:hypothetical protein
MSGIETAARVAALREKAARARFAAAGARLLAASDVAEQSHRQLSAVATPPAGSADDLAAWRSGAELRAAEVQRARSASAEAEADRTSALQEWQDLSRRREALDEVLVRWRAAQQAKADKDAQRLMDDLARRREAWA